MGITRRSGHTSVLFRMSPRVPRANPESWWRRCPRARGGGRGRLQHGLLLEGDDEAVEGAQRGGHRLQRHLHLTVHLHVLDADGDGRHRGRRVELNLGASGPREVHSCSRPSRRRASRANAPSGAGWADRRGPTSRSRCGNDARAMVLQKAPPPSARGYRWNGCRRATRARGRC